MNTEGLSNKQTQVMDAVVRRRKSIFFTGSAGTGKSFLLNRIIEALSLEKNVYVTASTGIAATHINGTTLHGFAACGVNVDFSNALKRIRSNPAALLRWKTCSVLIIDEVSMVEGAFFTLLDAIAQTLRQKHEPFGGIQLIVAGDFLQLPPVCKNNHNQKDYVFQTPAWKACIREQIVLDTIFRQREDIFVELLQNMRFGYLTNEQDAILSEKMKMADRGKDRDTTQLYSDRRSVDAENTRRLAQLIGHEKSYEALMVLHPVLSMFKKDQQMAANSLEKNCLAPKLLKLKVGAHVMLLKNLSPPALVNGSRGHVVGFDASSFEELPIVEFENGESRTLKADVWEIKTGESVLASYKQVPLCLAWALTIHKCQGMTLEAASIDIGKCWEPGQAYVAISRCTTLNGVNLLSYARGKIHADQSVVEYYASLGDTHAKERLTPEEPIPIAKKAKVVDTFDEWRQQFISFQGAKPP